MYLFRLAVWTLSATTLLAATVQGATRTVCASGCMYTNLQPAIDAAQPGDTILLRAGETFIGNYILRAKSGTTEIIIRSDAAASSVPASGVRLVPSGRTGGNTALSSLARLRGQGATWRARPSSGPTAARTTTGCSFSRLTARTRKGTRRSSRSGTTLRQTSTGARALRASRSTAYYIHGDPVRGQKRCLALDSASTNILNSYFEHCKHFASDAQAIAGLQRSRPIPD